MEDAADVVPRDWSAWHRAYDDPASRLSQRLRLVQQHLRRAIDDRPSPLRIVSMCAGEGRDVIGVLAGHPRRSEISARLVELDPRTAAFARAAVRAARLDRIDVLEADAALTDSYAGVAPAEIILACGIFGNISDHDVLRTIAYLPCLCAPAATVIWTRGRESDRDFASTIRSWFSQNGFDEVAFEAPAEQMFRVGVHRLATAPRPLEQGVSLFQFLR